MASDKSKRQKYRFFFQIKQAPEKEKILKRRPYFDPTNPYQLIKVVLLDKARKQRN